ncbi:hypothetical protein OAO01_09270 [Oligoflexia bacterium]|nr:hypothetical protein [Oligoflexia bacterium]
MSDVDANGNGAADCLDPTAATTPGKPIAKKLKPKKKTKVLVTMDSFPGAVIYKVYLQKSKAKKRRKQRVKTVTSGNKATFRLPPGRYKVFYTVEANAVTSLASSMAAIKIRRRRK